MSKVLFVMSAADRWTQKDGTTRPTGFFAEEVAAPHEILVAAGHTVRSSSPGGRRPALDRVSVDPDVAGPRAPYYGSYVERIADDLSSPLALADVDLDEWDALLVPGGHAPCEDLHEDPDLGRLLVGAVRTDVLVAAVCHGPAALLSAVDADGSWAFAGRRQTCFTVREEEQFGTAENAPWQLEDRLRELGAQIETGPDFASFVVRDDRLITGQNPSSSSELARAVVEAL